MRSILIKFPNFSRMIAKMIRSEALFMIKLGLTSTEMSLYWKVVKIMTNGRIFYVMDEITV